MSLDVKCLGRLVRDPISRSTATDKQLTAFTFVTDAGSTNSDGKRNPLYLNVNAWGKNGENIIKYCKKGTQLLTTGNVYENSTYTRKEDGQPAASLTITLEKFEFVSPKRE